MSYPLTHRRVTMHEDCSTKDEEKGWGLEFRREERREQLEHFLGAADQQSSLGVQLERGDRGPADGSATGQAKFEPSEMLVPIVQSRMEQRGG